MALWPSSVLVEVGILLANKGINLQGILGIFTVTFGNDSQGVKKEKEKHFSQCCQNYSALLLELINTHVSHTFILTALNKTRHSRTFNNCIANVSAAKEECASNICAFKSYFCQFGCIQPVHPQ